MSRSTVGLDDWRRSLVSGLSGRVVEIGAGTGSTFAHYPRAVSSVVAVEPDPSRRAVAERAARRAPVPIVVIDGVAERLPAGDGAFDGAVVSLVLCSVERPDEVVNELRRVLRPEGELRFLEHVIAARGPLRALQRLAAPIYSRLPGGCHIDRDIETTITRVGFFVERCERFTRADGRLEPAIPHVLGTARNRRVIGGQTDRLRVTTT